MNQKTIDNWEKVSLALAKVGYERMFEDEWDNLPENSIERALWVEVALNMLSELWRLYESKDNR